MRILSFLLVFIAFVGILAWSAPPDAPTVVKRVDPAYPALLKMAGIEGDVELQLTVDATGSIESVTVLKSTREEFTNAAKEAIKQWQFSPAMDQGKPVRSEIVIPFSFQLGPGSFQSSHDGRDSLRQNAIALLRRGITPGLRSMIDPRASIIIRNKRSGLLALLDKQTDASALIEGNDVAMGWSDLKVDRTGDAAVLAFESTHPSRKSSRFHTIMFMMERTGWVIQSWHVSP